MDAYIGEIRILPYVFPPRGWATCDGQLLSIQQNTALFSLLGTYYGGNGSTTFALPDFRDRSPMSWGQGPGLSNYNLGQAGGDPAVMLTVDEIAQHQHQLFVSANPANAKQPAGQLLAQGTAGFGVYGPNTGSTTILYKQTLGLTGNSAPHNNMQPYLAIQFCICMQGIYPPRSTLAEARELFGVSDAEATEWEGTVQGEPSGGPARDALPPGVVVGHDPSWEGTRQGFPESEAWSTGVEDAPSE